MNELKKYKFCDLYSMSSGISTTKNQAGHGAPFLSFSAVFNNYFVPHELIDCMDTSDKEQKTYSVRSGDIFLTRTSEVVEELAMSSVAIKDYPNATYSGFLKRVRPSQVCITYPKYMAFYLRSPLFRKTMTNNAVMTLRASLNEAIFSYLDLLLPKYEEQVKAGDLLYLLNRKIELNNKINAELEAMAKTLYDYWFVQFDFPISKQQAAAMGNPSLEGKPYKTSGGKMVYNPTLKREIPEGWTASKLENCVDLIIDHRGKTPKKLGGSWTFGTDDVIALSAKIVKGGKLVGIEKANKVSKELYEKWMPVKLKNGDILLTSEAPAGESYFLYGNTTYCLSQRLFAIRADQRIIKSSYLYYDISFGYSHSEILGSLSGSTVFGIRQDVLRAINIVAPSKLLQSKFEAIVIPQLKQRRMLEDQNCKLEKLLDWLLPMLMNGQGKII